MTLLHVESDQWRATELTPDSPLLPTQVFENIILVRTTRVLDTTLPGSYSAFQTGHLIA